MNQFFFFKSRFLEKNVLDLLIYCLLLGLSAEILLICSTLYWEQLDGTLHYMSKQQYQNVDFPFLMTMIWIHFSDWVMFFNNNINIIFTWRIKKFLLFFSFRSYSFTYHLDFSAFWALNCWIFCYLPSCFRVSNCLLFFFVACRELAKSHGMALQITVNKIYLTQAFFSVLNEICPVLVTLVLGNTL